MGTYISLLRGINVSGQKKILMSDLKSLYSELGFSNVQTYIQSGNVVFQSTIEDKNVISKALKNSISQEYNFDVPLLIVSLEELEAIANQNPYLAIDEFNPKFQYVGFLFSQAEQDKIQSVATFSNEIETFEIKKSIIYFYCRSGYGKTKFSNNFFESKLKVVVTTRNWNSTLELINIAKKIENQ